MAKPADKPPIPEPQRKLMEGYEHLPGYEHFDYAWPFDHPYQDVPRYGEDPNNDSLFTEEEQGQTLEELHRRAKEAPPFDELDFNPDLHPRDEHGRFRRTGTSVGITPNIEMVGSFDEATARWNESEFAGRADEFEAAVRSGSPGRIQVRRQTGLWKNQWEPSYEITIRGASGADVHGFGEKLRGEFNQEGVVSFEHSESGPHAHITIRGITDPQEFGKLLVKNGIPGASVSRDGKSATVMFGDGEEKSLAWLIEHAKQHGLSLGRSYGRLRYSEGPAQRAVDSGADRAGREGRRDSPGAAGGHDHPHPGSEALKRPDFDPRQHPRWPPGTPNVAGEFRDDLQSDLAQQAEPVIPTVPELRGAPPSSTAPQAIQNGYAAMRLVNDQPEVKEAQADWGEARSRYLTARNDVIAVHHPPLGQARSDDEISAAQEKQRAAGEGLRAACQRLGNRRATGVIALISELRGTARQEGVNLGTAPVDPGDAEAQSVRNTLIEQVEQIMPHDFVRDSNVMGSIRVGVGAGQYQPGDNRIQLYPRENSNTSLSAAHEFMHRVQHANPQVRAVEREFYEHRTKGEDLVISRIAMMQGIDARVRPDKFIIDYTGRNYGDERFSEVSSTGVQFAFGEMVPPGTEDPWQKDSEHVALTLGLLTREPLAPEQNAGDIQASMDQKMQRAVEGLPLPQDRWRQSATTFDQLTLEGKQAQDDYEALLDLGEGVGDQFGADVHHLGSRTTFDEGKKAAAVAAVAEKPDRFHVVLVPHKGDARLREKVERKYDGDVSVVTDYVRGSILVPDPEDIPRVIRQLRREAEARGCKVGATEDRCSIPHPSRPHAVGSPTGYRDVATTIRAPNGHVCELQVMTTTMFLAKEQKGTHPDHPDLSGHSIYEDLRALRERWKHGEELTPEQHAEMTRLAQISEAIYAHAWRRAMLLANTIRSGKK